MSLELSNNFVGGYIDEILNVHGIKIKKFNNLITYLKEISLFMDIRPWNLGRLFWLKRIKCIVMWTMWNRKFITYK